MTGNLDSAVLSMPWFPGKERHLLRAQIARISASCTLAVKDWYEVDEESPIPNKIKQKEDAAASFPPHEELETPAGWQHAAPFLCTTGKSSWPDTEALKEILGEDAVKDIEAAKEAEPAHAMLESIEADLEELKPEDGEAVAAWSIKVFGDKGLYTFGDDKKSHRISAVRSLVWPGALTAAQGSKFANIYVGYGLKCGTLVPPDPKSGHPLRGTSPFLPLVPGDIMEEPQDLNEHDEPNPQEDEAESDKASIDGEDA